MLGRYVRVTDAYDSEVLLKDFKKENSFERFVFGLGFSGSRVKDRLGARKTK